MKTGIYIDGFKAAQAGQARETCPHRDYAFEHADWIAGWKAGLKKTNPVPALNPHCRISYVSIYAGVIPYVPGYLRDKQIVALKAAIDAAVCLVQQHQCAAIVRGEYHSADYFATHHYAIPAWAGDTPQQVLDRIRHHMTIWDVTI